MAGSKYISVGDLKEGFNQVDNEEETSKKMAVLIASGSYLPRGLTFGATNGPEDFQELVFTVFARRLYKEWFLFLDDLSVATGKKVPTMDRPSDAHDVVTHVYYSHIPQTTKTKLRAGTFLGACCPVQAMGGALDARLLWPEIFLSMFAVLQAICVLTRYGARVRRNLVVMLTLGLLPKAC